jgi:hypothetical protein
VLQNVPFSSYLFSLLQLDESGENYVIRILHPRMSEKAIPDSDVVAAWHTLSHDVVRYLTDFH